MLVVMGDATPLRTSSATCRHATSATSPLIRRGIGGGSAPSAPPWRAAMSQAHAIRHGWRIACVPPGSLTGKSFPTRSKPSRPPYRISPPQIVPSVPCPVPSKIAPTAAGSPRSASAAAR